MISRQPLAKLLAYGLCPLLLALAGFGFWRLYNWIQTQTQIDHQGLVGVIGLAVGPLMLFALCAVLALALMGYNSALHAAQNKLEAAQQRLKYDEDLIKILSDYRPGATALLDQEGRYCYANIHAARLADYRADDMIGRSVELVLGVKEGIKLKQRLQQARMTGATEVYTAKAVKTEHDVFLRTHIIPLPEVIGQHGSVLVYEDDVTNLIVEREARERQFRQIIDTLVAVVDRRDPYAAGHSVRVGQVARAIAEEMELSDELKETAEIAGLLMNFGKVLVPREILTKTATLTADELRQVRESIMASADILSLIGFSLPVVPTLRQVLERWDGAGVPEGRKGEEILVTARIVSLANAFVAIFSPRAHRPSLDIKASIDALMADAGKVYDQRMVIALANFVQNRRHKLEWLARS